MPFASHTSWPIEIAVSRILPWKSSYFSSKLRRLLMMCTVWRTSSSHATCASSFDALLCPFGTDILPPWTPPPRAGAIDD